VPHAFDPKSLDRGLLVLAGALLALVACGGAVVRTAGSRVLGRA